MDMHRVKITLTSDGRGKVMVDGHDMMTTHVSVFGDVDEVPTVNLTLLCSEVEVEADATVNTEP